MGEQKYDVTVPVAEEVKRRGEAESNVRVDAGEGRYCDGRGDHAEVWPYT